MTVGDSVPETDAATDLFDNGTVDKQGHVFLQEDPGNAAHLAKIWMYDIDTDQLLQVAKHNSSLFGDNGLDLLTNGEHDWQ